MTITVRLQCSSALIEKLYRIADTKKKEVRVNATELLHLLMDVSILLGALGEHASWCKTVEPEEIGPISSKRKRVRLSNGKKA